MHTSQHIYGLHPCLAALKANFALIEEEPEYPDLTRFELFKHYENIILKNSFKVKNTGTYALILEMEYRLPPSKHSPQTGIEDYFYTFIYLGEDYGHILLRRETLHDKINEFFRKKEIDFPRSPEFSDKFYILAQSPSGAAKLFTESIRSLFVDYRSEDIEAEILGPWMVIGDRRGLHSEHVVSILKLAKEINGKLVRS